MVMVEAHWLSGSGLYIVPAFYEVTPEEAALGEVAWARWIQEILRTDKVTLTRPS